MNTIKRIGKVHLHHCLARLVQHIQLIQYIYDYASRTTSRFKHTIHSHICPFYIIPGSLFVVTRFAFHNHKPHVPHWRIHNYLLPHLHSPITHLHLSYLSSPSFTFSAILSYGDFPWVSNAPKEKKGTTWFFEAHVTRFFSLGALNPHGEYDFLRLEGSKELGLNGGGLASQRNEANMLDNPRLIIPSSKHHLYLLYLFWYHPASLFVLIRDAFPSL